MKLNKNVIAASVLTLMLALPLMAMAVVLPNQPNIPINWGLGTCIPTPAGGCNDIPSISLIDRVLSVVWWVFIGIVVIFFIIIAVLFLSSQGNPEAVATARRALIWGGAGVIIGVLAFGIIKILTNTLGISTTG